MARRSSAQLRLKAKKTTRPIIGPGKERYDMLSKSLVVSAIASAVIILAPLSAQGAHHQRRFIAQRLPRNEPSTQSQNLGIAPTTSSQLVVGRLELRG